MSSNWLLQWGVLQRILFNKYITMEIDFGLFALWTIHFVAYVTVVYMIFSYMSKRDFESMTSGSLFRDFYFNNDLEIVDILSNDLEQKQIVNELELYFKAKALFNNIELRFIALGALNFVLISTIIHLSSNNRDFITHGDSNLKLVIWIVGLILTGTISSLLFQVDRIVGWKKIILYVLKSGLASSILALIYYVVLMLAALIIMPFSEM